MISQASPFQAKLTNLIKDYFQPEYEEIHLTSAVLIIQIGRSRIINRGS